MFVICFVGSAFLNDHGEFCVYFLLLSLSSIMIRILCVFFMHLLSAPLEMSSLHCLLVHFVFFVYFVYWNLI